MSMPRTNVVKVDLADNLKRYERGVMLASADKAANKFGAEVYQDGKAASLTGYTVVGYFIRTGVDTITINGTVDGNKAYVVLPESCYYQDGAFTLSVKLRKSGYEQTLAVFDGIITQTITDRIIDSEKAIPFVDAIMQRSYYNWLDNSNFIINQRGGAEYTTTGLSLDRWRFREGGSGSLVKQMDRGIRIDVGAGGLCGMYQRIATQDAPEKFNALAGKPFTLAIKIAASTIVASGNCGIDLLDHNNVTVEGSNSTVLARKTFSPGSTGIFVANGTMPESMTYAGITALFRTSSGSSSGTIDIEWMALYEGTYTADTLPPYAPRGYAHELLECQRYYFRTAGQGWGYCTGTSAARINIPTPVMMRVTPSVDNASIAFTCHNNGSNIAATVQSVAAVDGASVRLNLTCDGQFTKFTPLSGYATEAFGLSADL